MKNNTKVIRVIRVIGAAKGGTKEDWVIKARKDGLKFMIATDS